MITFKRRHRHLLYHWNKNSKKKLQARPSTGIYFKKSELDKAYHIYTIKIFSPFQLTKPAFHNYRQ